MAAKRKTILCVVKVSAPREFSAAAIRREVRTLINEQTTYYADHGDIKALAVQPLVLK